MNQFKVKLMELMETDTDYSEAKLLRHIVSLSIKDQLVIGKLLILLCGFTHWGIQDLINEEHIYEDT